MRNLTPKESEGGSLGHHGIAEEMRLAGLLESYLRSPQKRLDIRKDATRAHYKRSVRQFSEWLGRPAEVADLTDENLAGWAAATLDEGLSPATANQRTKQLRALWEWAARQRIVDVFPTYRGIREPERLPIAWTDEELQKLFAACASAKGWIGPHRARDWWLALHYFLFDTGERIDAALSMRPEHLDLVSGFAKIPANIRKGGQKPMVYRLRPATCDLLRKIVARSEEQVFTQPWRWRQSFYNRYSRLLDEAGLPRERHKSGPKKMRVTVLSLIECAGGDATAFARHSSRAVTEAYIDRTLLLAHNAGKWPNEKQDPMAAKPSRWPGWLKVKRG